MCQVVDQGRIEKIIWAFLDLNDCYMVVDANADIGKFKCLGQALCGRSIPLVKSRPRRLICNHV